MFSRLLVPVEISGSTEKVFCALQELVAAGISEITLFHVVNRQDAEADPGVLSYSQEVLKGWRERLEQVGIPGARSLITEGIPWVKIVDEARQGEYSMILMGSQGKGMFQRVFLGNETENVLHHANRPVLILKLGLVETIDERSCARVPARILRHILFATDFSSDADRCVPYLEQMAGAGPEELTIAHIQDLRSLGYATKAQMAEFNLRDAERLERMKVQFTGLGYRTVSTVLKTGNAIIELLEILRERRPSLLVLGAKGRTNVPEMVLGGVSETLIHRADCHLLVIR